MAAGGRRGFTIYVWGELLQWLRLGGVVPPPNKMVLLRLSPSIARGSCALHRFQMQHRDATAHATAHATAPGGQLQILPLLQVFDEVVLCTFPLLPLLSRQN